MDNVINQSTVINGEESKVIICKDLTGQTLTGRYTLIACVGKLTVTSGNFYLYNCSGLVVINQNNAATVIRDGYAIGDYLFTANANPAVKYGGYWEEVPNGTFLMAAGAGGTADQTGGEATHTLTIEEMPSHSHELNDIGLEWSAGPLSNSAQTNTASSRIIAVNAVGGGQAHNNLPPYRTAHIYKRIANPGNLNMQ